MQTLARLVPVRTPERAPATSSVEEYRKTILDE